MLFKILKLFGLDVPAKVAEAKSVIEQRIEEVADYAKQVTQTATVIAALSAFAAILAAMAIGVGLFALYRVIAESYGVNAGLGVVAGVLIVAALVLFLIARTKGASLSKRHIFKPSTPSVKAAASAPTPAVIPVPVNASTRAALAGAPADSAGDLIEPLAFLLAKYVKYPTMRHPVLNELVAKLRMSARGSADEAIERVADLVRHGDRTQLLTLLGGAAFVGWLLARQNPDVALSDVTPTA
jgi:hypothetical protein